MKYVNIVYDDEYNDCDIISVPDDLLCDLEKQIDILDEQLQENYRNKTLAEGYYSVINGKKYPALGTHGIVNWLNNYLYDGKPVVSIINMHVDFCDKFPKIEL